jgi:hypothetical protein
VLTVDRRHDPFDTFLARALRVWASTTALVALGTSVLYVATGSRDFSVLIQTGPASIRNQTLACVVIAWLSAGVLLVLLRKSRSRPERCVAGVASLCLLLLYVNVLRERIEYGDVVRLRVRPRVRDADIRLLSMVLRPPRGSR